MNQRGTAIEARQEKSCPEQENALRYIMYYGVRVSFGLMLAGLLLLLVKPVTVEDRVRPLSAILGGFSQFHPMSFLDLGLLLLFLTPAIGVLVSLVGFLRRCQWLLSIVTLGVVAMLVISFIVGGL